MSQRALQMTFAEEKRQYWDIVVDCLVELFGQSMTEARDRAKRLRSKIEGRRGARLFYHAEPLNVAADLADLSRDYETMRGRYDEILHRRHWAPTELADKAGSGRAAHHPVGHET